ncbi:ABC transporter ATP-binding protein [Arthrobacter mobilis]|uniref:ABC transporter ATP-binding protein n=1 Tax=Arthrobacter mobilis TaxID=2724944 RepID=A0A7X6HF57_9MICC|nr:ABC transporter ATP-binding protein [Arthrobacter mobilis]NKX55906.1 ABC transporter ATP-binding protein [Arthrobacter mobilis]
MSVAEAGEILETEDLSWSVGGIHIIRGVSLRVTQGEFLSVIGPNGAGKTSLINLVSGVVRPTAGAIRFGRTDITRRGPADRAKAGIARTFQTSSVFLERTVLENVRLAAQARLGGSGSLFRRPRRNDRATELARDALERSALQGVAYKQAGELTHADKRKLELAILAVQRPKLLLLDEPTSGAAAEEVDVLIDIARGIHREGNTVVMVEHHIELVASISDRIAVMHNGGLLMVDSPDVVLSDPTVQKAYLGEGL